MASGSQNGLQKVLPSVAVSRAMLAMAKGRKKLDLILDSADPKGFVRQLPAEDLYFAIREIGLNDVSELVALASPQQFRAFIDLDVWHDHLPDSSRVLGWLELAAEGSTTGLQNYRTKRNALDAEIMLAVLHEHIVVHSLEENDDPEPGSNNVVRSAEGKYLIEITTDGEEGMAARRLVQDYIDENPFEATRRFEAVRWESRAELEETALRWRTGRMRDMGFPELEEALRIWAPLPTNWKPESSRTEAGPVSGVPALLLVSSRAPLFLDRIVERLPDATRPFFNEGLIYLLNCAFVAEGIEPKDLDQAREALAATRDMLSLGLELTSGASEEVALGIVASTPPVELFRYCVGVLAALAKVAATAVKPLSFGSAGGTALDPPDSEIISGLRRKRPRLYSPPSEAEKATRTSDWRAFRHPADLELAEAAIRRARAAAAALTLLGVDAAAVQSLAEASGRAPTAISVSQLLLTVLMRSSLTAFAPSEVVAFCEQFADGHLRPEALEQLQARADAIKGKLPEELQAPFAAVWAAALARFEDEIGPPCAAGGVEAPFVECVLISK